MYIIAAENDDFNYIAINADKDMIRDLGDKILASGDIDPRYLVYIDVEGGVVKELTGITDLDSFKKVLFSSYKKGTLGDILTEDDADYFVGEIKADINTPEDLYSEFIENFAYIMIWKFGLNSKNCKCLLNLTDNSGFEDILTQRDIEEDYNEMKAQGRDPYGYYGVNPKDFY